MLPPRQSFVGRSVGLTSRCLTMSSMVLARRGGVIGFSLHQRVKRLSRLARSSGQRCHDLIASVIPLPNTRLKLTAPGCGKNCVCAPAVFVVVSSDVAPAGVGAAA